MPYLIKEFKPCPFCGRIWMTVNSVSEGRYAVRCRCGANGPAEKSKETAIRSWNVRDQHLLWNPFRLSIRFPKTHASVDFKGNLGSLDLATVLQTLASREKTGILQVIRDHSKSVIVLRNGNIVAASDSRGNRIGQILYNNGMISHQKLQEALKTAQRSDKMLGEVLLSMGFINTDTLREVIHQQVQDAVLELLYWKEGSFEYRDCMVEFGDQGMQEISTMEIIMESIRQMDERDELHQPLATPPPNFSPPDNSTPAD
jgi:Lar family restriction alleviation protein